MVRKWIERWIAHRAFNALYTYHTIMSGRSDKASNKVIEVLDIIRKDL